MIINFLGDSITEGCLASKYENTFVYLLGQKLGAETRNYGISGTRIAKQMMPSAIQSYDLYFASRVDNMKNDADFILVFGGTNDFGHGDAPFGQFGDKLPDTFYGAVDYLINKLFQYYKQEQIIFLLPLHRVDENDAYINKNKKTLDEYRCAIKAVTKHYNIKTLDIKDEVGNADNNRLFADGLHPNDEGHLLIADLLADKFKHFFNS